MDWKARVSQSLEAGTDAGNAGGLDISIVPFIEEMSISEGDTPVFDADKVFSFLKDRKLECPKWMQTDWPCISIILLPAVISNQFPCKEEDEHEQADDG